MSIISDFHMHTPLCGHAIGQPEEYVKQGIAVGLKEMGFSDHAPFVHMRDPGVTMDMSQLPDYHAMILDVKERYADQITIKLALEVDFIPGYEDKTRAIVDAYPYDYTIGSVHFINDWGFDDPGQRSTWDEREVNAVYHDYYELLRKSARFGIFNIIGHCDLVKKFGHRATEDMSDEVRATAKVFKETGMTIEINTAGLRKPAKEMYPAPMCLEIYAAHGVPLTFGSDAHDPKDVGKDFDKARDLALACGFTEYVTFKNKTIDQIIKL